MPIVGAILAILQAAPQLYQEVTTIYGEIKGDLSPADQATIDAALAKAQADDAAATAAADQALSDASKR